VLCSPQPPQQPRSHFSSPKQIFTHCCTQAGSFSALHCVGNHNVASATTTNTKHADRISLSQVRYSRPPLRQRDLLSFF
jgi:hypothetical protein